MYCILSACFTYNVTKNRSIMIFNSIYIAAAKKYYLGYLTFETRRF